MLVYLVFLLIFSLIIMLSIPRLRFTYADILRRQFTKERFVVASGRPINFYGIRTADDFWTYMEKVVSNHLYNDDWYSQRDSIKKTKADDKKILFENKILGVPRIRQVRVKNDSCIIHAQFAKSFPTCYGPYNYKNEDTSTFGVRTGLAYHFNHPDNYYTYWGRVAKYHIGGYYQDLGTTRKETVEIFKNLKDNLWIQRNTRAIFFDFTVYNGNINLFCIIKLVFEFPPTGGILTTSHFYPADLIKYVHREDYIILVLEIIYTIFIIYYTIMEVYTFRYLGKYYFMFCWNYIEMAILIDSYISLGFGIFRHFYVQRQIAYVNAYPDIYVSYEYVGMIHKTVNNILGITMGLLWAKIFKFINLSKTWGQLGTTLSSCAKDIIGFSIMFFIIFFAFAQVGYLLFGGDVSKFRTFGDSLMTLIMALLREFAYYDIQESHQVLAPIYFVTYIFLVFFVLINMFLAIITDSYAEVKAETNLREADPELDDYLIKRSIGRWLKSTSIFPGEEILNKLKTILRTVNFSNVEILEFLNRHGLAHKREITREDLDVLLESIKKHEELESELDVAQSRTAPPRKPNRVTMDAFLKQQDKIDILEYEIEAVKDLIDSMHTRPTDEMEDNEDDLNRKHSK